MTKLDIDAEFALIYVSLAMLGVSLAVLGVQSASSFVLVSVFIRGLVMTKKIVSKPVKTTKGSSVVVSN